MLMQCTAYGKTCAGCGKTGHLKKACCSRRERAINKKRSRHPKTAKEKIETVSIDPSLLMAELEIHAGPNKIVIPYKIDIQETV